MKKSTLALLGIGAVCLVAGGWYAIQNTSSTTTDQGLFATQSVTSFDCATANTGIPVTECEALVALYNSTDGDNWTRKDNWMDPTQKVSTWHGVKVSNGSVTELNLVNNKLSNSIPDELGQLSNLKDINLSNNKLSGPIPAEIGQLSNVQNLWISNNQLSGPIPAEIGQLSSLKKLYLNRNQLSGPIPTELGQLSNLQYLWLNINQLSGPIPVELSQLSNLKFLWLTSNQLCGAIPRSFMDTGIWNPTSEPNQVFRGINNLLDDQSSYSTEMWNRLVAKGFVNTNTNRIPQQTPEACGDTGGTDGQIGDYCLSDEECASGLCEEIIEGTCVSRPELEKKYISCGSQLTKGQCEYLEFDGIKVCNWEEEVVGGVCVANCGNGIIEGTEQCDDSNTINGDGCSATCEFEKITPPTCGNNIIEDGEQCDGSGCAKGQTCASAGSKAECTCQSDTVIIEPTPTPPTRDDGKMDR